MASRRPPADRLPFIEGMRGLAALYVVFVHFCSMSDPRAFQGMASHAPADVQRWMAPLWHGHLAVAIFIVISGYCLQTSLFPRRDGKIHNLGKFLARRARRILPPYYACLAVSVLVSLFVTTRLPGMPFSQYLPVTWQNVAAHLLLIHNFSPDWMYKLNGVLWSISIEAQLYLLFPILVLALFKVGRWQAMASATLAAVALLVYWPPALKLHVWYLPLFLLGMACSHLAYRPNLRTGVRPTWGTGIFLCASIAAVLTIVWKFPDPVSDLAAGLGVGGLMYAGATWPYHRLARALAFKPVVALGAMSYSLYLIHHPIMQIVYMLKPDSVADERSTFLYLIKVGLPVILAGAAAFWYCFERPFMSRLVATSRVQTFESDAAPKRSLAASQASLR